MIECSSVTKEESLIDIMVVSFVGPFSKAADIDFTTKDTEARNAKCRFNYDGLVL